MLRELKRRNKLLYWFGIVCWIGGIICLLLSLNTDTLVLGINAYIKPVKFFISVAIAVWTFAWLLYYLEDQKKVYKYGIASIILLSFELIVITGQAARGKLSHFNVDTVAETILFQLMGIAILVYTVWTGYMCYLFYKQKQFSISSGYVTGIKWGIIAFVVFALEGGIMGALMRHTVHGTDGGEGLPFINWNISQGDLRVAHFFGMHGLQVLAFTGYLLSNRPNVVRLIGISYITIIGAFVILGFFSL